MYNGIGLLTARGSGTSGYVQNNKFNLRHGPPQRHQNRDEVDAMAGPKMAKPDKAMLEHKAKREIELKVAEEQARLEELGMGEAEIEDAIVDFRALVTQEFTQKQNEAKLSQDTHAVASRKAEQMDKLARAFGVDKDAVNEGDAFNKELQEQKKQEQIEARELREIEKAKRIRQKEREKEKQEKEAKKYEKQRAKEQAEAEAARQLYREEQAARRAAGGSRLGREPSGSWQDDRNRGGPRGSRDMDQELLDYARQRPGGDRDRGGGGGGGAGPRGERRVYRRDESPERYQPEDSPPLVNDTGRDGQRGEPSDRGRRATEHDRDGKPISGRDDRNGRSGGRDDRSAGGREVGGGGAGRREEEAAGARGRVGREEERGRGRAGMTTRDGRGEEEEADGRIAGRASRGVAAAAAAVSEPAAIKRDGRRDATGHDGGSSRGKEVVERKSDGALQRGDRNGSGQLARAGSGRSREEVADGRGGKPRARSPARRGRRHDTSSSDSESSSGSESDTSRSRSPSSSSDSGTSSSSSGGRRRRRRGKSSSSSSDSDSSDSSGGRSRGRGRRGGRSSSSSDSSSSDSDSSSSGSDSDSERGKARGGKGQGDKGGGGRGVKREAEGREASRRDDKRQRK